MRINNFEPQMVYSDMINVLNRKNSCFNGKDISIDICFFGDSITEGWEVDLYFRKHGFLINRGVGGETAVQAAVRYDNILQLKPKWCVTMLGINDIIQYFSRIQNHVGESEVEFKNSLKRAYSSIIQASKNNGIQLLLCSVMPIGVVDKRNEWVLEVNNIIQELCRINHVPYVDYHSQVVLEDGKTLQEITMGDGVHPSGKGYDIMARVLEKFL